MANLKEVRERISSVISTQQITKAMKMVAAAKLRRAQQAIVDLRPYSNKLSSMLANILEGLQGDAETSFGIERPVENALVVVITSNKGLCGGFNTNVSKMALKVAAEKYSAQHKAGKLTYLFIGKKGHIYLKSRISGIEFNTEYMELVDKDFSFEASSKVSEMLMKEFEKGKYDAIDIVYGQFKNPAVQNFVIEPFLPVAKLETEESEDSNEVADFIFEPNQKDLLEYLVPTILKTQFHKTILDSNASEQGARMTAMDKASENAEEILKELKINYNKARQEAITAEISEIVGGVAALEGA